MPIIPQTIQIDEVCRIAVIGMQNVGVSNIISRYTANEFNLESSSVKKISANAKTQTHQIEDKIVTAIVYPQYLDLPNFNLNDHSLRGTKGFILAFDLTNSDTFTKLDSAVTFIREFDSNAKIVLFGNKSDLKRQRKISLSEAQRFAEHQDCLYFEGSALESINIVEAFEAAIQLTFPQEAIEDCSPVQASAPGRLSAEHFLKQFFEEHTTIRKRENSRFKRTYCMFRTSEVKPHWTFTEIIQHAFHDNKHQNSRSKKALMNLGWVNENNQVLETAPEVIKEAARGLALATAPSYS